MKLQPLELLFLVFTSTTLSSPAPTLAPVKPHGRKHTTFLRRTCPTTPVPESECGVAKCGCLCYNVGVCIVSCTYLTLSMLIGVEDDEERRRTLRRLWGTDVSGERRICKYCRIPLLCTTHVINSGRLIGRVQGCLGKQGVTARSDCFPHSVA